MHSSEIIMIKVYFFLDNYKQELGASEFVIGM